MSSAIPSTPNTTNAHGNGSPGAAGAGGALATVPGTALCMAGGVGTGLLGPDVFTKNSEYSITFTRYPGESPFPPL